MIARQTTNEGVCSYWPSHRPS